jgi:hypothetical protein
MAFILTEPNKWSPCFNHLTYVVESSNAEEPEMQYIFELYNGTTLLNTSVYFPRPDGTCRYDPSKVLQNYLEPSIRNEVTTGAYSASGLTYNYHVVFKERYMVDSVLTTYTIATGDEKYTWSAAAQWESGKSLKTFSDTFSPKTALDTNLNAANVLGIKNYPINSYDTLRDDGLHEIRRTEKRVLTYCIRDFDDYSYSPDRFAVKVIDKNGGVRLLIKNITILSNAARNYQFWDQPVGITELNAITYDSVIGTGSSDITTDDIAYFVEFYIQSGSKYTHKPVGFRIIDCDIYEPYTVIYASADGGDAYMPMTMKNYREERIKRNTMDNYLPHNYNYASKVTRVLEVDSKEYYSLSTNWFINQYQVQEMHDLLKSPRVFLYKDGIYIPVIVENATYNVKNKNQDKLISYNVVFREAFTKNYIL